VAHLSVVPSTPVQSSPTVSLYSFLAGPATTVIYTLSLHDALPISWGPEGGRVRRAVAGVTGAHGALPHMLAEHPERRPRRHTRRAGMARQPPAPARRAAMIWAIRSARAPSSAITRSSSSASRER